MKEKEWWQVSYSVPGNRGVGTFISDFIKLNFPHSFIACLGIYAFYLSVDIVNGVDDVLQSGFFGFYGGLLFSLFGFIFGFISIAIISIGIPKSLMLAISVYIKKEKFDKYAKNAYIEDQ